MREEAYSGVQLVTGFIGMYFKWKSKFGIVSSLHKYHFPKSGQLDVTK